MKQNIAYEERLRRLAMQTSTQRHARQALSREPLANFVVQASFNPPDRAKLNVTITRGDVLKQIADSGERANFTISDLELPGLTRKDVIKLIEAEKKLLDWLGANQQNAKRFIVDPMTALERSKALSDAVLLRKVNVLFNKTFSYPIPKSRLKIHAITVDVDAKGTVSSRSAGLKRSKGMRRGRTLEALYSLRKVR
jgi:hypothetical protein